MIKKVRKLLLICVLFLFFGILIGYLIDRYKVNKIKKQQKELLNQINGSLKNLDRIDDKIDSLKNSDNFLLQPSDTIKK
jgi:uncharacterized membrane-anchored protein YhcB (DUF1043 family)